MSDALNHADDALAAPWQQTVQSIREQPAPIESLRTLIDTVERWPVPRRQSRSTRVFALCSMAASILLAFTWLAWPTDSWAQVVQAMQQKQWIRMTSIVEGKPSVNWLSLPRGIIAWRRGDAVYHDSRLKVIFRYDESAKTIFRLPEDAESRKTLLATQRLFTDILQNKNELDGTIQQRLEVVHQERHDITSDGKKLIEYHLQCQIQDNKDQRLSMLFQVDPSTHLAQKLIIKNLTPRSKDEPNELQFQIDYPEQGPLDIYDLGFAKTTKLVDSIPPEDVERMVNAIKLNRENFDAYTGIIARSDANSTILKNSPSLRIWRKGNKWRIEAVREITKLDPPDKLIDPAKWWLEKTDRLAWRTAEVCDGKHIYTPENDDLMLAEPKNAKFKSRVFRHTFGLQEMNSSAANNLPEIYANPIPEIGNPNYSHEIISPPKDGPLDTIQLNTRLVSKHVGVPHLQRYWLDSSRNYLVVRLESGEWNSQPNIVQWRQIEKLNRTPSGIWYPEVIKENRGTKYYYLDFTAKLDDSLFEPKERKKER